MHARRLSKSTPSIYPKKKLILSVIFSVEGILSYISINIYSCSEFPCFSVETTCLISLIWNCELYYNIVLTVSGKFDLSSFLEKAAVLL